jgi:hypothetical protein
MLGTRVRVVEVIARREAPGATDIERMECEFLRYLEAPELTEKGLDNLFGIFRQLSQRLTVEQLQELMNRPMPSEKGCMCLPVGCGVRKSRFEKYDCEAMRGLSILKPSREEVVSGNRYVD